jgi:predicted TIM-barrel fold metal-dependent hydrolase
VGPVIVDADAYVGRFWPGHELADGQPESVRASLASMGVGAAFVALMEAPWYRDQQVGNDLLARLVEPHRDYFVPLACIDPSAAYASEDLNRCVAALSMAGVRLFPTYHHYCLDDVRVVELARELGLRGLPAFVTLMMEEDRFAHPAVREKLLAGGPPGDAAPRTEAEAIYMPSGLGEEPLPPLIELIAQAPDTTFVISMAQVEHAHALLNVSGLCDNRVFFDIGRMDKPTLGLDQLVAAHGAEQLVFGSHAPFHYPQGSVLNLAYRSFSADVSRAILSDNYLRSPVLRAAVGRRSVG